MTRYRFHDQPIDMWTGLPASCKSKSKPAPKPTENPSPRRRPPTLKEMNERNREFWARKENRQ